MPPPGFHLHLRNVHTHTHTRFSHSQISAEIQADNLKEYSEFNGDGI